MNIYFIPKGCHYSNFLPRILSLLDCNYLKQSGTITFTDSCKYKIDEESCVNKLFGFCFGLFGVHKNSVRFGWTYDKELDNISIWKYVYTKGMLTKYKVYSCKIGERHTYSLVAWKGVTNGSYDYDISFKVDDKEVARTYIASNKWFALTLGPYFGGKTKAPHTIKIIQS